MRKLILTVLLLVVLLMPCYAEGDPNMDGSGGGGTGEGNSDNVWSGGDDGVRVTIILDGIPISTLDYSNVQRSSTERSFKPQCKLYYKNGGELKPRSDQYTNIVPTIPLPRVISTTGASTIDAIRQTFTTSNRLQDLARDAGLNYDELISGPYKLMLEPVSYFKYDGVQYAMTATEAALFDVKVDGKLRYWMGKLTHQNQPLAMYLEHTEFGILPWNGGLTGKQANIDILNYLGVGIVTFTPKEEVELPETTGDYTYHTDTDVITSVLIRNPNDYDVTPDDDVYTSFHILGKTYRVQYSCPAMSAQLVWFKWHTPEEPQEVDIAISNGEVLTVTVGDVPDVEPPDPDFEDRNPGLRPSDLKLPDWAEEKQTAVSWSEWIPVWVPPMGLIPGYWTFNRASYDARLDAEYELTPDERVQTEIAYPDYYEMKSGYGVNATCEVRVRGGEGVTNDDVTPVQYVVATFPEFQYKTYDRLLTTEELGHYVNTWTFKENVYSYYKHPVHFTPLWYPDNWDYTMPLAVFDAWTPGGQLYTTVTDRIRIDLDVYKDWYIRVTRSR